MLRFDSQEPLLPAERELITSAFEGHGPIVIGDRSTQSNGPCMASAPAGGVVLTAIGWLIISVVGAGSLIVLKAVLNTLGSELGKRLIQLLQDNRKGKQQPHLPLVTILCELDPTSVVLVQIDTEGFGSLEQLLARLQSSAQSTDPRPPVALARFDLKAGEWRVVPQQGLAALHYLNEDGTPKIMYTIRLPQ